ncbi:MAG: bifunctional diguanylate cyclase/phosphodiesterase [Nocardioidaceae bacterium]|nr:bifunctional diguanylate cyclase/phosphodiesterase [Nocardioidaceae bacterium]
MNHLGARIGLAGLGVAAVFLVAGQSLVSSPHLAGVISNLALLAVAGWAGVTFALRARVGSPGLRSARILFAGYCFTWLLGRTAWTFYEAFGDSAWPSVSWVNAVLVAATLVAIAGGFCLSTVPVGAARLRSVLDGLLVGFALFFVAWTFVTSPVIDAGGSGADIALGFAYPLADIVLISVVTMALPELPAQLRKYGYLFLAGLLCIGVADCAYAYLAATGGFRSGTLVDAGWLLGFGLLVLSATLAPPRIEERFSRLTALSPRALLLPYLFLAPVVVLSAWYVVSGRVLDTEMVLIGMASFVVMLVRQIVTVLDSEARAESLVFQATHDSLTGLWNRAKFYDYLASVLSRRGETRAVLFMDVDDFKDLNDGLGHAAGDEALCCVARRLEGHMRKDDVIARLGGDEFGIVLRSVRDADEALRLAERVNKAVSVPVVVHGEQHEVSASIGVALSGTHGETAGVLLRNAELAMYAAKREGKSRCALYDPSMHVNVLDRVRLLSELRTAIEQDQFRLHYQPKYDLRSDAVSGAEALLRWQHPEKGLLSPTSFLETAEQTGLIVDIGRWAMQSAFLFIGSLRSEDVISTTFEICVNVAPRQLKEPDFIADVTRCLALSPLQPHQLVFEVTESAIIDSTVLPALWSLKSLGVRVALDDFGTGFSSLSYLDRFDFDVLKIDQLFIADLDRSQSRRAMVAAIIEMAHTMGLISVAEGIEQESQLAALRELGCDGAQGYLLSKPLTEAQFVSLLSQTTPAVV